MEKRIILASASPRRREILESLGYKLEIMPARSGGATEERLPGESPRDYVMRTAIAKAKSAAPLHDPLPLVAADTTVALGDTILPKPRSAAQEMRFLRMLSGNTHEVLTAVAVMLPDGSLRTALSVSRVTFRTLADEEIEAYAATSEPYDKAGGYAVQGLAGVFISRIEGSYSGVMGLPVCETATILAQAGCGVFTKSPD